MVRRRTDKEGNAFKVAQTFFCLDADTEQPVCFTSGSSSISVNQATPRLLSLSADILNPQGYQPLVVADTEHYSAKLIDHVAQNTQFDLLVPMYKGCHEKKLKNLNPEIFEPRWAGFATAKVPYQMVNAETGPHWQLIERFGERAEEYLYTAFLATRDRDELEDLTVNYPKRWHVEEFFNTSQALGWKRGRTQNLNIRYAQMTMALIAQASLCELRKRLGHPYASWEAKHFAASILNGIDGDIRVWKDTIVVTFYNAPNSERLRRHYEGLPEKLEAEGVNPCIPWLYNFKLDFRFK
jgi:hypothetical protein